MPPLSKNVKISAVVGVLGYALALALLFSGWSPDQDVSTVLLFVFGCLGLGAATLVISLTCFVAAGEGHTVSAGTAMLVLFFVDGGIAVTMLTDGSAPVMGLVFGIYGIMGTVAVGVLALATFCCCGPRKKKPPQAPANEAGGPLLRGWLLANGFAEFSEDVGDLTKADALSVSKDQFVATYRGVGKDAGSRALKLAAVYNRLVATPGELGEADAAVMPASYRAPIPVDMQPNPYAQQAPMMQQGVPPAVSAPLAYPTQGGYATLDTTNNGDNGKYV